MGSVALDANNICSYDYITLGLKNLRSDSIEKPQVLTLLSSFLERSVETNEKLLKTSEIKDVITIFHGLRAPSLTIQQYIDRIFKYSCCSPSCFVIAHIYLDRFVQKRNLFMTSLNIHRLLITSVMIAAKFMDDAFFNNAYYAKVGGISTKELNRLEMNFLFGLDFRLHVTVKTFEEYCSLLKREAKGKRRLIEHSLHACAVEQNHHANKEESACAHSITR